MKKNILHLITSLNIGGTERILEDIIIGTKNNFNHSVGYIKEYGPVGEALTAAGVSIVQLPSFLRIIKYIKRLKPNIIHTHLYRANILGRVAGRICKIPVISSRQSTDTWRNRHQVFLDRITSRWCSKIIANSKNVADLMVLDEKVPYENIEVVYSGVSDDWFVNEAPDKDGKVIGFVGRLHTEKGADLLPEFAKLIKKKCPQVKIKIAGGGPLKDELKKNLTESGMSTADCSLLGWLKEDELKKFYDSITLLVLLSRLESFPRVLIEAGARGVPAAAPDIGGISEFVEDGKTGFLYEALNMREASDKVALFYKNNKIIKMRQKVLKKSKEFTIERMLTSLEEIYHKITQAKKNRVEGRGV